MEEANRNKHLLSPGDLCISSVNGIGYIERIEEEDVWFPIIVKFEQQCFEFGKVVCRNKFAYYDVNGEQDHIDIEEGDVKFYKQIVL